MAKIGRICGVCGNIGQVEKSSLQASAENQPGIWICENCRTRQTEMADRRKPDKAAAPAKKFENSKVKFLSSEDVISMGAGNVRPCVKRSTTISSRTTAPIRAATPNASGSGSKETGHEERGLKGQLPYHRDFVAWKGSLEVRDLFGNSIEDLAAYFPLQISSKLFNAIETLPTKLQMRMVPLFAALPKRIDTNFPKFNDIGIFLLPSEDRSCRLKTINLLRQLDSKKHALKMKVNASHELVVHSSQLLAEDFQRIDGDFFLWGIFCSRKMRSNLKKKKYSSPKITPGKTYSEFRTPIAQDKRSDVIKSNQADEVVVDTFNVCGNNSLEKKVAAEDLDVPPGFTKLPVKQERSTMEIKSSYKEVAPVCSSFSDKNNEDSGRKGLFSSTGVGILEATLEECENQEEYFEAPGLTDKDAYNTSASPKMPQQIKSPLFSKTPAQISIKHEKEPLIPFPIGLEISPGYSRTEIEAGKAKNISNQHLEIPPGFAPLDRALIKQEQDSFPSFSGSIEQRKEENISCLFNGSQPSMNQVLNVHTAVADHFMDRPLLENQNVSFSKILAQSRDEFNRLYNTNQPIPTPSPSHYHVLNPSFIESSSIDKYYPSISKQPADITATREEQLQRDQERSRSNSRCNSPVIRRRYRSRSKSPVMRRYSREKRRYKSSSRSRSPIRRRHRSRSRSRSPNQRQYRRNRPKSTVYRRNRGTFRSYRWNPVYRNPGHAAGNTYDSGQNYGQNNGCCSSGRFRSDYASDEFSPWHSRGRDRSNSFSPPPPVDSSWN